MLRVIESLSNALVQLLHPLVEVSIFEAGKGAPLATYHRLEADVPKPQLCNEPIFGKTHDGRSVKLISLSFQDSKIDYIVQLRADISVFSQLHQQLTEIIQKPEISESKGTWQQQITDSIHHYLDEHHSSLNGLSRRQKRQLVFILKQRGLLDYKEATSQLAKTLNLSRATIYNYLHSAELITHLTIHQVNSFSDKPHEGNPAGVVLDAEHLDTLSMQSLARELNYSETAFLIPSKIADFQLRFFSRDGTEVKFCGHSTVGTLYMLAKEQHFTMNKPGDYKFSIKTLAGVISAQIHIKERDNISISFQAPKVNLVSTHLTPKIISDNLCIPVNTINSAISVMRDKTNQVIFITMKSLNELESIQCDFKQLKVFMKEHNLITCCLLVPETIHKKNDIHMRCFCPTVGVNEDPFTGSVLGGLAAYIDANHLIQDKKKQFNVEQGHFLGRPGEVTIQYENHDGNYFVEVYAKARHFFSTEIELINREEEKYHE